MAIDVGIVLTGTIIPNSTFVVHSSSEERKQEYLAAIKYYKDFAPVFFLENSTYPLFSDRDFFGIENFFLRKFPTSEYHDRGKGYQEFEMISKWLKTEVVLPKRFIKITGRYKILNFKNIFRECLAEKPDYFLIDRRKRSLLAMSRLFCIDTDYFKRYLMDIYLDCNDQNGDWVERVFYRKILAEKISSQIFSHEPIFVGVDGTTGAHVHAYCAKRLIKSFFRRVNYCFDKQYIHYL